MRESLSDLAVWVVQVRGVLLYPEWNLLRRGLGRAEHLDAVILRYAPPEVRQAVAAVDIVMAIDGEDVRLVHFRVEALGHTRGRR